MVAAVRHRRCEVWHYQNQHVRDVYHLVFYVTRLTDSRRHTIVHALILLVVGLVANRIWALLRQTQVTGWRLMAKLVQRTMNFFTCRLSKKAQKLQGDSNSNTKPKKCSWSAVLEEWLHKETSWLVKLQLSSHSTFHNQLHIYHQWYGLMETKKESCRALQFVMDYGKSPCCMFFAGAGDRSCPTKQTQIKQRTHREYFTTSSITITKQICIRREIWVISTRIILGCRGG